MATVTIDEIEGSSVNETADGFVAVRTATVTNVDGTAEVRALNAINDPQLPAVGDAHPTIAGITLQSKTADALGKGQFRVRMEYTDPNRAGTAGLGSPADVQVGTTVQEAETSVDRNGNPLLIIYEDRTSNLAVTDLGTVVKTLENRERRQVGTASIFIPLTTLTFKRRTTSSPLIESLTYVRRINLNDFVVQGDRFQWFCKRIDGFSPDGGQTYDTTYEFVLAPDGPNGASTWDIPILFVDPETGEVPGPDEDFGTPGVVLETQDNQFGETTYKDGNGVKVFRRPYLPVDFANLELIELGALG